MTNLSEREQWFLDRVGKRVWMNKTICKCPACIYYYNNGVIISLLNAKYIYFKELLYNRDGIPMKYFDTPEERDAFELTLKK